jgi:hypothetical protein
MLSSRSPLPLKGLVSEQSFQPTEVGVGQTWGGAGLRLGVQAAGLPSCPDPAGDGFDVDAEHPGDGLAGLAVGDSLYRPLAAAFQFVSGSNGSAHTQLEEPSYRWDRYRGWIE